MGVERAAKNRNEKSSGPFVEKFYYCLISAEAGIKLLTGLWTADVWIPFVIVSI